MKGEGTASGWTSLYRNFCWAAREITGFSTRGCVAPDPDVHQQPNLLVLGQNTNPPPKQRAQSQSRKHYAAFRTFAHLARWAAAIFFLAATDIVRFAPVAFCTTACFVPAFTFAQRSRCAAAIRARPAADIVLFLVPLLAGREPFPPTMPSMALIAALNFATCCSASLCCALSC
jgi:hypothetical protein